MQPFCAHPLSVWDWMYGGVCTSCRGPAPPCRLSCGLLAGARHPPPMTSLPSWASSTAASYRETPKIFPVLLASQRIFLVAGTLDTGPALPLDLRTHIPVLQLSNRGSQALKVHSDVGMWDVGCPQGDCCSTSPLHIPYNVHVSNQWTEHKVPTIHTLPSDSKATLGSFTCFGYPASSLRIVSPHASSYTPVTDGLCMHYLLSHVCQTLLQAWRWCIANSTWDTTPDGLALTGRPGFRISWSKELLLPTTYYEYVRVHRTSDTGAPLVQSCGGEPPFLSQEPDLRHP